MPNIAALKVGDALPERSHKPDMVQLFMYNAAIWNPHRIHYDYSYTTQVEKHCKLRSARNLSRNQVFSQCKRVASPQLQGVGALQDRTRLSPLPLPRSIRDAHFPLA